MTRLRRVSCQQPGWRRLRSGRGFRYLDEAGNPLGAADRERVKALVIPPAWTDVWICPDERGHLQAVGTDSAGRRQYLYHPRWRELRDLAKFDRLVPMARRLPRVRARLRDQLEGEPTGRHQVLAAAVLLVDLGCFRLGADEYAEQNGSRGLTTLERADVSRNGRGYVFDFVGKSGVEHELHVEDPQVCRVVGALAKSRRRDPYFLAARQDGHWSRITADVVNNHIRELFALDVTAKDLRTWAATVTVAVALAEEPPATSRTARARQVRSAITEAAELLGNTPAVARSAYVDPRVLDLHDAGKVLARVPRDRNAADRAVVRLLTD